MKKLLMVTLLFLCAIPITFAQVEPIKSDATLEDYERYVDKRLEMSFRLNAMEAIDLTPEEINEFNPVFERYANAKDRLADKKFNILEKYSEEMEEEDDADDRIEETSDMIEDYWEAQIAEMELKKQYYDILENKIPYQKAIDFFIYEETVENRIKYDILRPSLSTIIKVEKAKGNRKVDPIVVPMDNVSKKTWDRYIDKRLEMDFRLAAIDEMYLTPEEIKVFNPMFDEYMDAKDELAEKQLKLIDKYAEKIKKEEDADDRAEERSDFIEDYWETEIASLKLREAYFDKMENQIPYYKAAQFFLLEETLENRIKYDVLIGSMPAIVLLEEEKMNKNKKMKEDKAMTSMDKDETMVNKTKTTKETGRNSSAMEHSSMKKKEMNSSNVTKMVVMPKVEALTTFDNWVKTTKGQMSLDHNYTSNGLKAVVSAVEATAIATNTTIEGWADKKAKILDIANHITIDPYSTMHADWVGKAFTMIGESVKVLNESNEYTYAGG